ncbi:hypothetical protein GCM10027289_27690 [Tsukamurella serpentis]
MAVGFAHDRNVASFMPTIRATSGKVQIGDVLAMVIYTLSSRYGGC